VIDSRIPARPSQRQPNNAGIFRVSERFSRLKFVRTYDSFASSDATQNKILIALNYPHTDPADRQRDQSRSPVGISVRYQQVLDGGRGQNGLIGWMAGEARATKHEPSE
jgi:hypothetical protein